MVARMGPLGKACKKCAADQKQKNVKRYAECQSDPLLLVIIRIGKVLQKVTGLAANGGF
jgi:hypothetical protein